MAVFKAGSASGSIIWNETGCIQLVAFSGEIIPQAIKNRFYFNGQDTDTVQTSSRNTNQVTQHARFPDGDLCVEWTGGQRIKARVEAFSQQAAIREAGFSLCLPKGDILVLAGDSECKWSECMEGQRISFDSISMAIGQFFLLNTGSMCLRIGRQVESRRDYTTGYLEKNAEGWEMVWKWQPQVPFPQEYSSQALEFESFDSAEAAIEEHRLWMEKIFRLAAKGENPKVPQWLKKTRLVLQVNLGETTGAVLHDYRDVTNLMEDASRLGIPEDTIFYIPDYNFLSLMMKGCHGPVCACWPENPLLGGKQEFIRMVEMAKKHRFHIMPHASIVLLIEKCRLLFRDDGGNEGTWVNPEWENMKKWAVVDSAGKPLGWPPTEEECPGVETWSHRYPYTVRYLDQAVTEVQQYFVEGISSLISEYGLDAMYFDSLSNNSCFLSAWNSPSQGEARAAGEREITMQLYQRHPNVLFAGEGCTEETVGLVPLWNWRMPVCSALFGKYVYTFAHTSTPSAIPQRYSDTGGISGYSETAQREEVELSRRQPNNIPTLVINYRDRQYDELTRKYIEELTSSSNKSTNNS